MNLASPTAAPAPAIPNLGAAAPSPVPTPAPASGAAPAPTKAPAGGTPPAQKPDLAKIVAMPVADAVAAATKQLEAVQKLTVGGGTKEGAAAALQAAAILQDTSMLVQVIHRNALPTKISPELELNLMTIATGIASTSSQVALTQSSAKPIALEALLAKPAKAATEVLTTVADHVARAQKDAAAPSVAGYL